MVQQLQNVVPWSKLIVAKKNFFNGNKLYGITIATCLSSLEAHSGSPI